MSLDLTRVVRQISDMASRLRGSQDDRRERVRRAVAAAESTAKDFDALKRKIASSRTTWLVAEPVERIDRRYAARVCPPDFVVFASDGSHIAVDRHHVTRCYLLNTGLVTLRYGSSPGATLESLPTVYSEDRDLAVVSPDGLREVPIEGNLLGAKRAVEELRSLVEAAARLKPEDGALGLLDGTLIMWGLEPYPDFVSEALLENGFLAQLDAMRRLAQERRIALAAYISFPGSADVINALRVALCPRDYVDSDRCPSCTTRECYGIAGLRDRDLFAEVLGVGERSALFVSPSRVQKRYGPHLVHFFYLRAEGEIARIEIPAWVAQGRERLELAHALILDQCRRGQGYPVVLSEAHEQAVVTGADRENFWRLVNEAMVGERLSLTESAKSTSKRTRWV